MTRLKIFGMVAAALFGGLHSQYARAVPVTPETFTVSLSGSLGGSGTLTISDGLVPTTGPFSIAQGSDVTTLTIDITENQKQFQFNLAGDVSSLQFSNGELSQISAGPVPSTAGGVFLSGAFLTLSGTTATFFDQNTGDQVFESISTIAAVPEPSTWAMLLLGFTGLGLMASRRRKVLRQA